MGCFVMDRHHPDFLKARVMVTLFGGYFGSRLMSNIREDKGYTYGIGAGIVSYPGTGILTVSTEAANEYVNSIITEVYREMDKLCNDLVPQEELEMVKNYMLGDLCRSYEGPFSLSDAWIYIETVRAGRTLLYPFAGCHPGNHQRRNTHIGSKVFLQRKLNRGHCG